MKRLLENASKLLGRTPKVEPKVDELKVSPGATTAKQPLEETMFSMDKVIPSSRYDFPDYPPTEEDETSEHELEDESEDRKSGFEDEDSGEYHPDDSKGKIEAVDSVNKEEKEESLASAEDEGVELESTEIKYQEVPLNNPQLGRIMKTGTTTEKSLDSMINKMEPYVLFNQAIAYPEAERKADMAKLVQDAKRDSIGPGSIVQAIQEKSKTLGLEEPLRLKLVKELVDLHKTAHAALIAPTNDDSNKKRYSQQIAPPLVSVPRGLGVADLGNKVANFLQNTNNQKISQIVSHPENLHDNVRALKGTPNFINLADRVAEKNSKNKVDANDQKAVKSIQDLDRLLTTAERHTTGPIATIVKGQIRKLLTEMQNDKPLIESLKSLDSGKKQNTVTDERNTAPSMGRR